MFLMFFVACQWGFFFFFFLYFPPSSECSNWCFGLVCLYGQGSRTNRAYPVTWIIIKRSTLLTWLLLLVGGLLCDVGTGNDCWFLCWASIKCSDGAHGYPLFFVGILSYCLSINIRVTKPMMIWWWKISCHRLSIVVGAVFQMIECFILKLVPGCMTIYDMVVRQVV